ncbi:AsnC family transcriptional regulator [Loktanella sp. 1ANDIMAR09]|nr:AsnC family transcriptional regulator [Loktanella sp. 1ANDIMAR09]
MDELDAHLIAALKRNGRASLSELAAQLGVTRSTVRVRLDRLVQGGEIAGFTVLTRSDVRPDPVRGLMMLEIAGRGAEKVMKQLQRMTEVQAVHSTNGTWDLIAEIGTDTLETFDQVLFAIRRLDGVTRSETNLLLSTRR